MKAKRFLVISAVVALAAASQAATFNWGGTIENTMAPAGDEWVSPGTVFNLIYLGAEQPAGVTGEGVSVGSKYFVETGLTDLGGTVVDSYTYTQEDYDKAWSNGGSYTADEAVINGWYLTTLYDPATPDLFDAVTLHMTGLKNSGGAADGTSPIDGILGMNMHGTVVHPSGEQPIPEPATAALLALGLAAFGLKRKARA